MGKPAGGPDPDYQHEREAGRRRLAPEERRTELLRAALEIFTEVGFGRATLQDVADRAGVTKGALYHYFDSKDQLFSELVRGYLGELVSAGDARVNAADPDVSRLELLESHLHSMWSTLQQPHLLELSHLIMTELPKFPEIGKAFFDEVVIPSRQTMRRILARGGSALPDGDLDALTAALPSMLLGVAHSQRVFREIDPLRLDPERLGATIIRAILDGVLASAAAR